MSSLLETGLVLFSESKVDGIGLYSILLRGGLISGKTGTKMSKELRRIDAGRRSK